MRKRAAAATSAGVALLLLASLAPLPAAAQDSTTPAPLIDLITVENRTTDAFGGGNQLLVRVGNSAFGVVYGGHGDTEGHVTFFAAVIRTLGTADVYEAATGRLVAHDVPLPVVTVVAERMSGIIEFRDQDPTDGVGPGDGIFNFRPNLSTPDVMDFNASEPLLKALDLKGAWELSNFALVADGNDKAAIEYSLSLSNVAYTHPGEREWAGDGKVDKVAFHVRMVITRTQEQLLEVPHYDATVARTRDGRELTSIEPAGVTPHNATVTRATMKIDHEIAGWDPAPVVHDSPPRLLLLTAIPVLNGVSGALAPWMNDIILRGERTTTVKAQLPEGGSLEISEQQQPTREFSRAQRLELKDAWHRTAAVDFEPTVQVWGPDSVEPDLGTAHFQVLGGARISERVDGKAFRGFMVVAGFSYPSAHRVYHDPEVVAESVEFPEQATLPVFWSGGVMAVQLAVLAACVLGAVMLSAYFVSSQARSHRTSERERLEALKQRYQLPPGGGST